MSSHSSKELKEECNRVRDITEYSAIPSAKFKNPWLHLKISHGFGIDAAHSCTFTQHLYGEFHSIC